MSTEEQRLDPTATIAFGLVLVALWVILTPYPGITHDGQGYALQAMARLSPAVFADDVFLRFQSQDDFTVYPLMQAAVIGLLDLDRGTSLLTLLFQIAWFASAWLVLRQLTGQRLALLGLGLLVVMPGHYGAMRIFQLGEPFLTARLPAEALSLLGIGLYLKRRIPLSVAALAMALLLHPLMAFPALLVIALAEVSERFGSRAALAGIALVGASAIVAGGPLSTWQPVAGAAWIELLRGRSPQLFTDLWRPLDWSTTVQALATLAILVVCTETRLPRRLVAAAIAVGITGLALAAVASTWPQLDLLLKGQPWRWLWLCRFLAIAMLPVVAVALWRAPGARRAAALILASSWLIVLPISARSGVTQAVPGILAAVALLLATLPEAQVSPSFQRLALRGAWSILAVSVLAAILTTSLVALLQFSDTADPAWLVVTGNVVNMAAPATGIVLAAWHLAVHGRRVTALAVATTAVIVLAAVLPVRGPTWLATPWSGASRAEFADWRELIPAQSEVLWWDGLREVWFLLQRRSYLTDSQAGGIVFSPDLVEEIGRRAANLEPYLPAIQWIAGTGPRDRVVALTPASLERICNDPQLGFVVAEDDLGIGAPSHVWPKRSVRVFLYDCGRVRALRDPTPARPTAG
jgi:hypothetical protein